MSETAVRLDNQLIARLVPVGSRVLDLGCGDGELLALLEREKKAKAEPRIETKKVVRPELEPKAEVKPAEVKTEEAPTVESEEKKKADSEDIDKKLEEILNI